MTKQLRKQFILVNMLLVGTVLLVVFAALGVSTYRRQVQDSQRVLERYFMDELHRPSPKLDFGERRDWKNFPMRFSFCAVVDSNGGLVSYQSDNLTLSQQTVEQAVQAAKEKLEATQKTSGTLGGLDLRYLAKEQNGQLVISFVERTQEYASMQDFLVAAFLLGSAGLVVLFLASWLLSSWVVRPVERSWAQQRQFVADASHELKTPLTVILANTGILLSHPQDTIRQQKRWVRNTQEEAVNMKKLVDEMLYLARTDGSVRLVYSQINLSDVVWSAVLPFESVAFEQGLTLDSDIAPDLLLQADEGRLREVIRILLDNACKYCEPKGKILVRLEPDGDRASLMVSNSCAQPMQQEELDHLFERFYRLDKARNREKGGYGLGLAIAKSIVEQHRGSISASMGKAQEILFTVKLPLQNSRSRTKEKKAKQKSVLPVKETKQ